MNQYIRKRPETISAEEIIFSDEQKSDVLNKKIVTAYNGRVSVVRGAGAEGEDIFQVGLAVKYAFVMAQEGDYLVYGETGAVEVVPKEEFERSYKLLKPTKEEDTPPSK
jgi:hypothetical protein